jgi:hypothetical protein
MNYKTLFGAVAACGLLFGVAHAQSASGTDNTTAAPAGGSMSSGADVNTDVKKSGSAADMNSGATPAAPAAGAYAQGASVTTRVVTMDPIPDTKENRERFGGPNSHAGRRTSPKGN